MNEYQESLTKLSFKLIQEIVMAQSGQDNGSVILINPETGEPLRGLPAHVVRTAFAVQNLNELTRNNHLLSLTRKHRQQKTYHM